MTDEARPAVRVIGAYLDVELELNAFDKLFADKNRLAAFHLQQGAEKLTRAVRLRRGLKLTKDHSLAILVDGPKPADGKEPRPLPDADPWRPRLLALDWLSAYATTFRYPTQSGRRDPGPAEEKLAEARRTLGDLLSLARGELLAKEE